MIITRSTEPQAKVFDLTRYRAARAAEAGNPVPRIESPAARLRRTEAIIRAAVATYGEDRHIDPRYIAAGQAAALVAFRDGYSAARAIAHGKHRVRDLAWGEPEGAA